MIATNAFKQAVVGTYTNSDTVIELNSISDTVGASDYLPNGGFNLILYDGLFGNPADANNAGKYEILECSSVNYATNEITVVRARENTTAVTIDASSWQVVYGATVAFFAQFEDADATILKQADVVDTLVSTSIIAPLSANQGKQLQDTKIPTADIINDLTTGGATKVLSAEQGKELEVTKAPIQDTDTWVLTINFTGSVNPIATNLARFTHTDYIGTGMTQASGVFTFPRTGIWRVEFIINGFSVSANAFIGGGINIITDASGTPVITRRADGFNNANSTAENSAVMIVINGLEVTNTADVKVSFLAQATSASETFLGSSDVIRTGMIFTRIGDLP